MEKIYKVSNLEVDTNIWPDMRQEILAESEAGQNVRYVGKMQDIKIFLERVTATVSIEKYLGDCNILWKFETKGYSPVSNGQPLHAYREQLNEEAKHKGLRLTDLLFDALFGPMEQKLLELCAHDMQKEQ